MFRVFKYKNFRLFFPGLIISQIGIWIQNVAISWLIYEITHSPSLTGFATFLSTIPLFVFTPFAGVLIDKFSKHKMLMILQILFLVQALIVTFLFYTKLINIKSIVILGIFLNMLVATDGPLRQSLFINIVEDKKDLTNAISINSSCFNFVKLIGPAISGLLIVHFGAGICFLINFLCILPNIILVALMNIKENKKTSNNSILKELYEGIKYIIHTPRVFYLQLFLALFCFMVMTYPMLMPIYTKDIFSANPDILGYLMASIGTGALTSSLLIALKKNISHLKIIMFSACFLISLCFILFGISRSIIFSLITAYFIGLCVTGFITPQISLLQSVLDNSLRGRVMSYNTICILGTASVSTVMTGIIVDIAGITKMFIIYGVILFLIGICFLFKFKNLKY